MRVLAYLLQMNARELIALLERDGWYLVAVKGSHHHYKHPTKPGKVTVPDHGAKDLARGTVASVLRQAGLK